VVKGSLRPYLRLSGGRALPGQAGGAALDLSGSAVSDGPPKAAQREAVKNSTLLLFDF